MATRLCDALETIADQTPQLAFVASALRKQMARSPIADEEIIASLVWVSEMINAIIVGPSEVPMSPMPGTLSDSDLRILEIMGNGEDLISPAPYYEDTPLPPEENTPSE